MEMSSHQKLKDISSAMKSAGFVEPGKFRKDG